MVRVALRVLFIVVLFMGVLVVPATAATYNVSNVADLEAALALVNAGSGGDTIVLAPGTYALTGGLRIDRDVTIEGDATSPTVLDGDGSFTILNIRANNVSIENLTLQHGDPAVAYEGSGRFAGTGITITASNNAFSPGDSGGKTVFSNSTIANNTGRGIEISCAEMQLTNVTVSNNAVGVYFGFPCGETMQLTNSLIVGNGLDCGGGGSFVPVGDASLDSDSSCVGLGFGPGLTTKSLLAIDLGSLASNGGPTQTESIPAASAAVNAGDNAVCPSVDQRGVLRADGQCDIGAFEFVPPPPANNTQVGSAVTVSPAPSVLVTFSQVTTAGNTTAAIVSAPPPPAGFMVAGATYDISTTAGYTGPVTVCLPYIPIINPNPRLYHYENVPPPTWIDRTTFVDTANQRVCGTVSSLSPFAVLVDTQSPQAEIQALESTIAGYGLEKGIERSLMAKLDAALSSLQRGDTSSACGQLVAASAFCNAQSGKKLTTAQAATIANAAQAIRASLGCR